MDTPRPSADDTSADRWYEVRVRGHLDARWTAWFDGLDLARENDGTTALRGPVADQAALHGLLQKVRDVGLPLVSVTTTAPREAEEQPVEGERP
jgi:hypothetical protein